MNGKLYVAVADSLGPGARLAQCAHAVAEVHAAQPDACRAWRDDSNTVVILAMPAARLGELAQHEGATPFREPDLGNELTAVAVFPQGDDTRRLLRRARLAA
jgi:hypothetical protein